jgi:hypothetical protein
MGKYPLFIFLIFAIIMVFIFVYLIVNSFELNYKPYTPYDDKTYNMLLGKDPISGNTRCAAFDGVNCYSTYNKNDATTLQADIKSGKTKVQPLTCGSDHKAKYGITGYDTPGHWCNTTLN